MEKVRIGVVGIGNMGSAHCKSLLEGKIKNAVLSAVCDKVPEQMKPYPVKHFTSSAEMIRSGEIDAIVIATPHYDHTTIGIDALQVGLHLMVEKPVSVHKADAEKLIAAHVNKKQIFSAMFNQRTDPRYKKIRQLIADGELGQICRVTWIVTDWFRTEQYYSSGGWRATWAGEGGGVLLNQCPHNLDLIYHLFGMPKKIRAFCEIGQFHDIEVEDNVTAFMEYENGMKLQFITTTGEAPGTNRLEIAAENGRVVIDSSSDDILWTRNEIPMSEFSKTTDQSFGRPSVWDVKLPISGRGGQHVEILNNFADAIALGTPLIAPAPEGINSVEIANAMLLSSFENRTIDLPLDSHQYERHLMKLIQISKDKPKKKVKVAAPVDMSASFAK